MGNIGLATSEEERDSNAIAQRIEDVVVSGANLYKKLLETGNLKRMYVIGTNGAMAKEVGEALVDTMRYIPAKDGTLLLNRKPNQEYEDANSEYKLVETDAELSARSKKAALDLFMDDETAYRELEHSIIKEFSETEVPDGTPSICIVGESALNYEANIPILQEGLVIWTDADPSTTWAATQRSLSKGTGLRQVGTMDRPPVWALAQGWEFDESDGDARVAYIQIVSEFRSEYEKIADIRLRTDVTGIAENQYWGAERVIKAINQKYGFVETTEGVNDELFEQDLNKFLEGCRLTKYMDPAKKWCEEQGATSIEELVENLPDLVEALQLKPLERKRIEKAAAVVAVAA
jgi:hypothetical protein